MSARRFCLIAVIACVITVSFHTTLHAQTGNVEALDKKAAELFQAGKYLEAIPLARQVVTLRETALGLEHPDVATALHKLGELYFKQGRYSDAESVLKRALAIREKTLGPENPDFGTTMSRLAEVYEQEGHYADAEAFYKRSLEIEEKALGSENPEVARTLNTLALFYVNQGRIAEAELPITRSLAIREKVLGPEHRDIARSLADMAYFRFMQGRYADAEPLINRAVPMFNKTLGPEHPDFGLSLMYIATLYLVQGRYADAESLYKRSLEIQEKVLGPDHPDIGKTLSQLAQLYAAQARYVEAEPLFKRALAIYGKIFNPDNVNIANARNSLAVLYSTQGRYADAEPLQRQSLAILENTFGPESLFIATPMDNLAQLYQKQGRYADAQPLYMRSFTIRAKVLGTKNVEVGKSLNNLATLFEDQGLHADAEAAYKMAQPIFEKAFGPDNPIVAIQLSNLALVYQNQGRYADAELLFKRSLAIKENVLGPDHPDVATSLNNLAMLYYAQDRYADAEPLNKRSLAIYEKALDANHPTVALSLNNLAILYLRQGRHADALPLVRRTIANNTAATRTALPVLFGAQSSKLIPANEAFDDSLNVIQQASQTAAGQALNALAVRFSAGNDRLAQLVRQDQDLAAEADKLDKAIIAAVSEEPSKRNADAEQSIRNRVDAVTKQRSDLQNVFAKEFPDYTALSKPQSLTVKGIQALIDDDEALVVVDLGDDNSHVWVVTSSAADWKQLDVTADAISKTVATLRSLLKPDSGQPFDSKLSFELYKQVLGPVEDIIRSKQRLSFVFDGALTSLPPQVLVTSDPTGKALKDVDWLIRRHAITILPSIASLKVLHSKTTVAEAAKPLIGFADPVFDRNSLGQNAQVVANVTADRGLRGTVADVAELAADLPALPESADELRRVAASVKAASSDVILGPDATETRVKQTQLDQYRVVYFATHGLVAGEVAEFAKLSAEPALVLSLPEKPTDFDDGLLTASEVAQLKLNADWVVLSACNTASGEKPGAEALSGLARAFFYAGGRSLLVSHWPVETNSAVALMTGTFSAIAADPKLSHGEALRKSMLAMIDDADHPYLADPKFWAPFVVVGEPKKPGK